MEKPESGLSTHEPISAPGALGVIVPQEVAAIVDTWRRKYDPNIETLPPHITIAYPPFIKSDSWQRERSGIATCLQDVSPFKVTVTRTGSFPGEHKVLWLQPESDGNFERIHKLLADRFPDAVPATNYDYVPHMTIGFFGSQDDLLLAQASVESELDTIEFIVSDLDYVVLGADGMWAVQDKIELHI